MVKRAINGCLGIRTHLVFVLFYSRLGHRIDGRESGDQVQMRSFMPRLQKLNYLCPAAAAERTAGGKGGGGEPTKASHMPGIPL